jgi:2-oxoisovalerate dehydrogenase E1 component
MTEGEVSEALQMAALKQYPLLVLVQDNDWDISANAKEVRSSDAAEYARGFPGINVVQLDGSDFTSCYHGVRQVLKDMRKSRKPYLIHAKVPLLNHHTSGVRMEWYRDDLNSHKKRDPLPKLSLFLKEQGASEKDLKKIENKAKKIVLADFKKALEAEDPKPEDLFTHRYAPTSVTKESGVRVPKNRDETVMVDSALFAMREILQSHPEALFYGQDVGARLGGVFREAATLAEQFGDHRVFNTPIQEAFIIGSTVGMAAVGLKPIVEVQFSDYIWPGLNQLFTELSRSYYLSNGKWPASAVIRVPTGAYGSGGPYHSSSVESVLTNINGIKIAYPSTGADLKGLMKSAFEDPNPVVILEHKGLYWSKIKGTIGAKTVEPAKDYIIPFGKGRVVLEASAKKEKTACIITYGMGVYWSLEAEKEFSGKIEIIDLRTLQPWDKDLVMKTVSKHGRALLLTEEPSSNTFANAISGEIQRQCFEKLDAPILVLGSEETPAIPLNKTLEATLLPNSDKVIKSLEFLLNY